MSIGYDYEKVFDYYVIEAWRTLDHTLPAYTPEMVRKHTEAVSQFPWVQPTESADRNLCIGQTAGWPRQQAFPHDPTIPPQTIYGYKIADPHLNELQAKMIVTAGNHGTEFTGSWVLEGLVNFLVSDDTRAVDLRRHVCVYIYPDINPDGRYQAVHNLHFEAAPDPNAGTNMRYRGSPQLYAAGVDDNNRVWNTTGRFPVIDALKSAMERDTGGTADYLWDIHGPQDIGNWRSPIGQAAWDCAYGQALCAREPEVRIAGLPGGYKSGLSFQAGKLSVWAANTEGLQVRYPYVYEPGGWTQKRLYEAGRHLVLALHDILHV